MCSYALCTWGARASDFAACPLMPARSEHFYQCPLSAFGISLQHTIPCLWHQSPVHCHLILVSVTRFILSILGFHGNGILLYGSLMLIYYINIILRVFTHAHMYQWVPSAPTHIFWLSLSFLFRVAHCLLAQLLVGF